jgi:hypothetical protein
MLAADGFEEDRDIEKGYVVENEHVLTVPVVGRFLDIPVKNTQHKEYKIRPALAKPVYEITPPYLAEKGSDDHQGESQQQKCRKRQKGVDGKKDPWDPAYEAHNQRRI